MSVPAKKQPHSKTRRRRSHHALKAINLVACPNCKHKIKPHIVCAHCGHYKNVKVTNVK